MARFERLVAPFQGANSTPSFSGGLRFAATPGYFLATLRVAKGQAKVMTTLRGEYRWAHTLRQAYLLPKPRRGKRHICACPGLLEPGFD
jgi:hypothetical protein